VLSSDFCRGLVSDNENDQTVTNAAFDVLHFIAGKRLEAGKLTVVDATNVQPEARKSLVSLAKRHHPRRRNRARRTRLRVRRTQRLVPRPRLRGPRAVQPTQPAPPIHEGPVDVEVPPHSKSTVILRWKRVLQHGVIKFHPDAHSGLFYRVPFEVVTGFTFDQTIS